METEEKTEIPKPPDGAELPKPDLNKEYLLKWKQLFTEINPNEIQAFDGEDEEFPRGHSFGRIDFWRLDGIAQRGDVVLVLKFSGYLQTKLGNFGCIMKYNHGFFEEAVHGVGEEGCEHLDTLGGHGLKTWSKMRQEILDHENQRRSEIPKPPIT